MEALLDATVRTTFGKNEARRTRKAGQVPAVVYGAASEGASRDAVSIAVEPKALLKILHSEAGANTLISLKLDGVDTKVLVKDFQLDPITHQVLHADFYRVAMDRMIQVTIPVLLKGESKGVKIQGGLARVRPPRDRNRVPAVRHPGACRRRRHRTDGAPGRPRDATSRPTRSGQPLTDLDTMLVHIILAKAEESAAAGDGATAGGPEPEVIKKGKKEEGEAEKKK